MKDYQILLSRAEWPLKPALDYMHNVQRREPSVFQHKCLEYIIRKRNSRPLRRGDAVLQTFGDLAVSNAVGMTYDWKKLPSQPLPIIHATFKTVKNSLMKSLGFAENLNYGKVAVPIMCTRKGGLTKEESSEATLSAIKEHFSHYNGSPIQEIVIVLYDKALQSEEKYFKGYFDSL